MPLLKDLISIPERVHQGDFVLQLSKGVTEPEQTLRDYVVTPQLVDAFSNAMDLIQHAVQTDDSKAAYLQGSFGSGADLDLCQVSQVRRMRAPSATETNNRRAKL